MLLSLHPLLLLELLLLLEHHRGLILLLLLLHSDHLCLHDLLLLRGHLGHDRLVLNELLLLLLFELQLLLCQVHVLLLGQSCRRRHRGVRCQGLLLFLIARFLNLESENAAAWLLRFEGSCVLVEIL